MKSVVYGGFWRRFLALVIDLIVMILPSIVFGTVLPYVGAAIFGLFYRPVFDASAIGASPGRALMGLRVTTETGERLSLKQAYIRYFMSVLSGLFMGLGFLISLFTVKRQTLHDMLAGTVVIEAVCPPTNFFSYWFDEVSMIFGGKIGPRTMPFEPGSAGSGSVESDVTQKLKSLKDLLDQKLITNEDYEKKKAELLSKIQ
ncbi:MAG: RDD family protein [Bdellovibrionaceae bacterium]|nr:RDD family protein [Pseudobdellovibrionaceae bacterium]